MKSKNFTATPAGDEQEKKQQQQQIVRYLHFLFNNAATAAAVAASAVNAAAQPTTLDVRAQHVRERETASESGWVPKRAHTHIRTHRETHSQKALAPAAVAESLAPAATASDLSLSLSHPLSALTVCAAVCVFVLYCKLFFLHCILPARFSKFSSNVCVSA